MMLDNHENDENDGDEPARLNAWLVTMANAPCACCGKALCGHERLRSRAIAGSHAPRCLDCLCAGLRREPPELRESLDGYIRRRACFSAAWAGIDASACGHRLDGHVEEASAPTPLETVDWSSAGEFWDAGDLGCGDLVLPLRSRLRAMSPGARLHLRAMDPAAPVDIPAWCRLTGHTLVAGIHPEYLIQRRSGD